MMIRLLIAIATLAVCGSVSAGELIVHTLSVHVPSTHIRKLTITYSEVDSNGQVVRRWSEVRTDRVKFNNTNFGLGWRTDNGWAVGAYVNSYDKTSVYVGKGFELFGNLGLFVGAATGYDQLIDGNKISPLVALEYKVPLSNQYGLRFAGRPKIGNAAGVVHTAVYVAF